MFKVMTAINNDIDNLNYCNLISQDQKFDIIKTSTGIQTIDTYFERKPDALLMDSNFPDINGIEILNRLSSSVDEKMKCNTILMANKKEALAITKTSKLYAIMYKPCFPKDALILINQMYSENHRQKINIDDLYSYFLDFKIHLSCNGCKYLKSAIELCLYNYPFYGNSFDNLLLQLAYQYHKEPEQIRDSIKNALKPINTSSQKYVMQLYPGIFIDDTQLTPKKFIERSTIYFHRKLKNK